MLEQQGGSCSHCLQKQEQGWGETSASQRKGQHATRREQTKDVVCVSVKVRVRRSSIDIFTNLRNFIIRFLHLQQRQRRGEVSSSEGEGKQMSSPFRGELEKAETDSVSTERTLAGTASTSPYTHRRKRAVRIELSPSGQSKREPESMQVSCILRSVVVRELVLSVQVWQSLLELNQTTQKKAAQSKRQTSEVRGDPTLRTNEW